MVTAPHSPEERNWAIAAHLSALVALVGVPFGNVIGPLFVYLTQRNGSPFVAGHARASLNFQITVSIAATAVSILTCAIWGALLIASPAEESTAFPVWVLGGWIALLCVGLAAAAGVIAMVVAGAVAASKEQPYRYQFTVSLVR
jgi:uncharacterized Tic20 family protein